MALQFRLEPVPVDRLSDADFEELFAIVDGSTAENVDSATAQQRLDELREEYEPNAQALADFLALELPPWFHQETQPGARTPPPTHSGRDLVGSRATPPQVGQQK